MRSPSIVPEASDVEHVVLDDFGKSGRAFRESEPGRSFDDVVEDVLSGQYEDPVRVVAFSIKDGWCRDVTLAVAFEVQRRIEIGHFGKAAERFLERHLT